MPLNKKKIIDIILEECKGINERCDGYREELTDVLIYIISAEEQHRVQGSQIQKKVNDRCKTAGRFLAERRGGIDRSSGDDS